MLNAAKARIDREAPRMDHRDQGSRDPPFGETAAEMFRRWRSGTKTKVNTEAGNATTIGSTEGQLGSSASRLVLPAVTSCTRPMVPASLDLTRSNQNRGGHKAHTHRGEGACLGEPARKEPAAIGWQEGRRAWRSAHRDRVPLRYLGYGAG